MHRLLTAIDADLKSTIIGQPAKKPKFLDIESEYANQLIGYIVAERYETLLNLKQYTMTEFLYLFECAIVYNINKAKALEGLGKQ